MVADRCLENPPQDYVEMLISDGLNFLEEVRVDALTVEM